MKRITSIFSIFAFAAALFALPLVASAQWNGGYPNGGYPGNGGYYPNNGGYGNYRGDIRGTVEDLYNQAKNFEHSVDRGYGRSNDKNFRKLVDEFVDATKDLKNNYRDDKAQNDAERVLSAASQIDGYMDGGNGGYYGNGGYNNGYGVEGQWNQMRGDLQVISNTYGHGGYNNRGYRNHGNSGWRNRFPFPF